LPKLLLFSSLKTGAIAEFGSLFLISASVEPTNPSKLTQTDLPSVVSSTDGVVVGQRSSANWFCDANVTINDSLLPVQTWFNNDCELLEHLSIPEIDLISAPYCVSNLFVSFNEI
jgi:hypothetical protein